MDKIIFTFIGGVIFALGFRLGSKIYPHLEIWVSNAVQEAKEEAKKVN